MLREAIILAGGLGTRLRSSVGSIPKSLAPVAGKPFLDWLLSYLAKIGFSRVILATGYGSELISARYGSKWGTLTLSYSTEDRPLGTGGAIQKACRLASDETIAVLNGDTFAEWEPQRALLFHRTSGGVITIVLKELEHFDRYGSVDISNGIVKSFQEKKPCVHGFINSGIYILDHMKMNWNGLGSTFSWERDVLALRVKNERFGALIAPGTFIDIGVPEDYNRAQIDIPSWIER